MSGERVFTNWTVARVTNLELDHLRQVGGVGENVDDDTRAGGGVADKVLVEVPVEFLIQVHTKVLPDDGFLLWLIVAEGTHGVERYYLGSLSSASAGGHGFGREGWMVAAFQRLVSVVGDCSVDELMLEARVRNGQER